MGERYIQVWTPGNGRVPFPSIITLCGGERFNPSIAGGGTAFPCVPLHFNHWAANVVLTHWISASQIPEMDLKRREKENGREKQREEATGEINLWLWHWE